MKPGFYTIMAAQFFSSLADNALLVAAIALLLQLTGPAWMVPMLKFFFVISYVVLAAWVGAFADSMPKGRVMFITNTIKVGGCLVMLLYQFLTPAGIPAYITVLLAYAIVGFGAAAYSPAKYGILTELLPPEQLVAANGWIEGTTVGSIILGTVLGGALVSQAVSVPLLSFDLPIVETWIDSAPEAAIVVIAVFYGIAAAFNLYIPDTGVDHRMPSRNPVFLVQEFAHCVSLLWRDRLGQISLATTTLFWGAGATLQFIVLKWAEVSLDMNLSQAAILQAVVAVGIAIGAVVAATKVTLRQSPGILPVGITMGIIVMVLAMYDRTLGPQGAIELAFGARIVVIPYYVLIASAILMIVGGLAGFFVVPMNALLQHRGHVLMGAGHSIAVQNFNENISILAMLAGYATMIRADLSIKAVILMFGMFVSGSMLLVLLRHRYNQRQGDSLHLIGMEKPAVAAVQSSNDGSEGQTKDAMARPPSRAVAAAHYAIWLAILAYCLYGAAIQGQIAFPSKDGSAGFRDWGAWTTCLAALLMLAAGVFRFEPGIRVSLTARSYISVASAFAAVTLFVTAVLFGPKA